MRLLSSYRLRRSLLALPLLALACASIAREARLRHQLAGYQLPWPLAAVWPEALKVVAERGFQLMGDDRALVGQGTQNAWGALLGKGFATRDLGEGRWAAESNVDGEHRRYRIEGTAAGATASVVRFISIQGDSDGPSESTTRDVSLELDLVRRIDPAAAERMTAPEDGAK